MLLLRFQRLVSARRCFICLFIVVTSSFVILEFSGRLHAAKNEQGIWDMEFEGLVISFSRLPKGALSSEVRAKVLRNYTDNFKINL